MTESLSVVMAGDVDHGKSTLLGRVAAELLGSAGDTYAEILDGLAEEREGEFTLDTTQIVVEFDGQRTVLIDVPGHAELLRNMVTGATRADAAVLVVAADEGFTAQSARHAEVLNLLGLGNCVVAVTKVDVAEFAQDAFELVRAAVEAGLRAHGLSASVVVPTYALEGDNVIGRSWRMPWYAGPTLAEAIVGTAGRVRAAQRFRFTVQNVLNGLVLGRVDGGTIRAGDEVLVYPAATPCRIVEIIRHGEAPLGQVGRGASVALRLEGGHAARGDVLTSTIVDMYRTSVVDVRLLNVGTGPIPLPSAGYTCQLPCREVGASVSPLDDAEAVGPGRLAVATIHLAEDVAIERFALGTPHGRIMLCRDGAAVAAAVVVQPAPAHR